MSSKSKRRKIISDKDDILSDYCCSFVRELDVEDEKTKPKDDGIVGTSLTGKELKEFYESITLHDSINQRKRNCAKKNSSQINVCNKKIKAEILKEPSVFEDRKGPPNKLLDQLLYLSSQGNIEELKEFILTIRCRNDYMKILNGSDQYGWTAIMCAAAEGYIDSVHHLIKEGCFYIGVTEKSGKTIYDICKQKGRNEILELLKKYENSYMHKNDITKSFKSITEEECKTGTSKEKVKCNLCGLIYSSSEQKSHEASMIHIFNDDSKVIGTSYEIPDHSVGFQMMLKSGWESNQGLGPEGSGRKNPIKTIFKQDRLGLGFTCNNKKRVNHFSAFDLSAVKHCKSVEKRVRKNKSKRTYEEKVIKVKAWERNMRHYMSTDF